VVAFSFGGLAYIDASARREIGPAEFGRAIGMVWAKAMMVIPLVALLVAAAFFVIDSLLRGMQISDGWLNTPVYICTLYGPFASVYWLLKNELLNGEASHRMSKTVLPV
jgi:hypothetical protein